MTHRIRPFSGFTLVELVIVVAIILVIASMALPPIQEHLKLSRETVAISNIKTIHLAQAQHQAQSQRFATTLAELGPTGARMIPESLASGQVAGYIFSLQGTPGAYIVHAEPETFGKTGRRTFFSDESQVIHHNWGAQPATAESREIAR